MKRYEKYKLSGIEWLGEIPEHWEVKRVKDCSKINRYTLSDKTADDFQFKYVDIGNVNQKGLLEEPELISFDEAPSRARRIVKQNDVIISTVRTYLKAIAFFDFNPKKYIVSTGFAVLSHKANVNPWFLSYHSQSEYFIDNVIRYSSGVSYPAINSQEIASLHVIYPNIPEQTVIANYLDTKTAAIDRKTELLTTKADKYKALRRSLINETVCRGLNPNVPQKDSGVEWIGMIPEHWGSYRMKDLGFLYSGLSGKAGDDFNQEENDNNRDFIPFTNIFNNDTINPNVMGKVVVFENEKQNKVKKDDLFFLMSSEDYDGLGKSSLLAVDLKNTYLNSFCKGFRITKKIVFPAFLNYQLQSDTFRKVMQIEGKGFTRMNLKSEKVTDFKVYLPDTKQEQIEIVEYLDTKTAQIDAILANIGNQIAKLTQLRKTLINDVVTGKMKVTE